jgi:hypothetical protein
MHHRVPKKSKEQHLPAGFNNNYRKWSTDMSDEVELPSVAEVLEEALITVEDGVFKVTPSEVGVAILGTLEMQGRLLGERQEERLVLEARVEYLSGVIRNLIGYLDWYASDDAESDEVADSYEFVFSNIRLELVAALDNLSSLKGDEWLR